jgi:N-acetylglucosaminyldiphosphoundecaprenol N-acetyl-beta-D-mannosaminyltransferase
LPKTKYDTMTQMLPQQQLINFSVSKGSYQSFIDKMAELGRNKISTAVYFANVHMFIEAQDSEVFRALINKADIVTPDGQPLAWMLRLLYGIKQDRVSAMDFMPSMLARMEQEQLPVYFYGGTQEMLEKAKKHVQEKYPSLKVAGLYSPPFRPLSTEEENDVVKMINDSGAGLVFVFLGCPKQERWMATMKGRVNAVMTGVGGSIPVTIGMQKRAPLWMQKLSMEWLYRLMQEPKRLFKRYAYTNSKFLLIMIREFIKLKFLKPIGVTK